MIGLGSSSTLGIGLVIHLRDQFTQNANKISQSIDKLHGNANKAMSKSFDMMIGAGAVMTAAGYGIMRGMKSATDEATEFQKVMLGIKAMGEFKETDMPGLTAMAEMLGPKYGKSAITVAKGMEDLVKAGMGAKDIPKVMEAILQTAMAANEQLEGETGVAARMVDIMMAWGMSSNQAARAGDILAKASIESTVSFNDLAESMKYSQDILKGLHLTFEESVALMGVLGNAGIKGSMAGTALGNAYRELAIALGGTSKKKNHALAALGIDPASLMDAYGNLKRPLEILDKIKEGVREMGDVQRQNVLNDLFGVRGKRGVNPLIDFLSKKPTDKWMGKSLTEMVEELSNRSAGSNLRIVEEKMKGIAFQTDKLKANWDNFKIAIGNALIPLLNWALPKLNWLVEKLTAFARTAAGKWMVRAIAVFGALLIPMGLMVGTIGLIGRSMLWLRGGFAPFRAAGLWVWNTLIARALTYLGIIKGIGAGQKLNAAGSLIDAATGRIITPAYKMKGAGAGAGLLGKIKNMIPGLSRITGLFTTLAPILATVARAFTLVGLISMGLSAMGLSLYNQFKMLVGGIMYVISTILNTIYSLFTLDWDGWKDRQNMYYEDNFGKQNFDYTERNARQDRWNTHMQSPTAQRYDNKANSFNAAMKKSDTVIHIHVDGEKTITKRINAGTETEMTAMYGLNH